MAKAKTKKVTPKQLFSALGDVFKPYEKGEAGLDDHLSFSFASDQDAQEGLGGLFITTINMLPGDAVDVLRALPEDGENVVTSVLTDEEAEKGTPNQFVGIYIPGIVALEQLRDSLPANCPENVAAASRELGKLIMDQLRDGVMQDALDHGVATSAHGTHVN